MKNLLLMTVLLCTNFKIEAVVEIVGETYSQTVPFESKADVYTNELRDEWEQKNPNTNLTADQVNQFITQGKAKNELANLMMLTAVYTNMCSKRRDNPGYSAMSVKMSTAELKLLPQNMLDSMIISGLLNNNMMHSLNVDVFIDALFIDDLRVQYVDNCGIKILIACQTKAHQATPDLIEYLTAWAANTNHQFMLCNTPIHC